MQRCFPPLPESSLPVLGNAIWGLGELVGRVKSRAGFDATDAAKADAAKTNRDAVDAPKPRVEGKHFGHDILEGLHYVWRDPAMRAMLIVMTGVNLCVSGPIIVGLAALAKFRFGTPTAFGVLIASWSAGALLGSIASGTRKQRAHRGWTMILASGIVSLAIAAIGLLSTQLSMAIVLAAAGVAGGYNNVVLISWFQERVEPGLMGRAMSVLMFGWVGLMPVSYPMAGALAQWSIRGMFLISGLTAAMITAACAMSGSLRGVQ